MIKSNANEDTCSCMYNTMLVKYCGFNVNLFGKKISIWIFSFIFQFLDQIGFSTEPYHLVGMSMGGALAGLYASLFPKEIHSVTMICPASKYNYTMVLEKIGFSTESLSSCGHVYGWSPSLAVCLSVLFADEIHSITMICPASKCMSKQIGLIL